MLSLRHATLLLALISGRAIADTNFANCDKLEEDAKQAPLREDPQIRLQQMNQLFSDMVVVNDESQKQNPSQNRSFLVNCYKKKKATFEAHVELARTDLQTNANYHKLMGRFTEYNNGGEFYALQYYSRAFALDPQDYNAFVGKYSNWFHKREKDLIAQKNLTSPADLAKFNEESNALIKPVVENSKMPSDVKAQLIKVRQKLMEGMMNSESSAQLDNTRLLEINPKDTVALTKLAAYAYSRKDWEGAHKYFDKLAPLVPNNQVVQERNIEMKVRFNETSKVATLTPPLAKKFADSAQFQAALAWVQLQQDQIDKAHSINSRALKLNSKNELARSNQEKILIKEGDGFKDQKMIAAALGSYDEAYKINPKNIMVRKKMPALIYEYHRAQNFDPKEVAQKDMDRLMEILDPIFNKDEIDRANVETYIFASSHSSKPIKGAKACTYYRENYSPFNNVEMVTICIKALKASGKKDEANDIAKKALENPRFQESRGQLSQELLN